MSDHAPPLNSRRAPSPSPEEGRELARGAAAQSESIDPAAEVTWGDFLAALPTALAMHPPHGSAPAAVRSSRTTLRRAARKKTALPRAYMAARAGARRARSATSRTGRAAPERSREGLTAAPGAPSHHTGLATADRWLIAGLMLASSVLVAVLTSALTVRGMQPVARAARPEVALRAQPVVVAAAPPVHTDSTQEHAEAVGIVAPSPARTQPLPQHVVPRAERHSVSLAEQTHTSLSASTVPVRTAPIAKAASEPATRIASAPASAAPTAAPAAATPLANPAVLEELRAIHAEIDARKRHMDSLTSALDSLNHVRSPD